MVSPSIGEMMATWFAAMIKAIDGLNKTMIEILAELKKDKTK